MAAATEIAGAGNGLPTVPDFEYFYEQCYERSVRLAWLLTHDAQVAEDLAQEAFVAVYRRFGEIRRPESFLYRTIVNQCRSWARRQAVKRRVTPAGREEHVDPAMGDPDLVAAVHRLPYRQRAAIVGRYWADMSESEIAEMLDCRPGTVKSLTSRALDTLRREVSDHG